MTDKLISYFNEEARRKTFKSWIFNSNQPCSADKMAEAGFIFTGTSREPDSAQCFFCLKHLDGWECNDDPWVEHLKHASSCEFAKMQKSQGNWTLAEWYNLWAIYRRHLVKKQYEKRKDDVKKLFDELRVVLSD